MIFRPLFEPVSGTCTCLLGCETTGQAMLIDPVVNAATAACRSCSRLLRRHPRGPGMLKGLHRYRSFAAGSEPKVPEQSVTEVVEAAFRRRGTVYAPRFGHIALIKSPDFFDRDPMAIKRHP